MRPRLRLIEVVVVPDERFGRALLLRDSQGVAADAVIVPAPLIPIVARFTGQLTLEEIAQDVNRETGKAVPVEVVKRLAESLDRALLLDSAAYRAQRDRIEGDFRSAQVREAAHAGGAYHAEPESLRRYLDGDCLHKVVSSKQPSALRGLIAPHIDPWRGALGYGHAYGSLRVNLPDEVDTFVLLGTSHAPMSEPFSLCRKTFATPLGALEPNLEMIDAIAERSSFDPYADIFNHKREHSLEFQALFLRHLLDGDEGKARCVRIVPILCGLGDCQRTGLVPDSDERANGFLLAVREVCEKHRDRVVVIAGADLAHVGPRFGDAQPYDVEERARLERIDRASLELAVLGQATEFFRDVQEDLDTRRVCGLGPIYTLLRALPSGLRGEVLHYEQTVDPHEGSIVSHAAVGFYG